MVLSYTSRLWYGLAGGGIAIGVFIHYLREEGQQAHTFKNPNYIPSVKWDTNWDRRDIHGMVKPLPKNSTPETENAYNENLEKAKPTATRHLILVRHGQYNLKGKEDKERFLTALGKEQATYTGKRLKESNFQYDRIVQSTLLRAVETASVISSFLPDVPLDSCDLLREGAPIPPEPPVGHWKPEAAFYVDGARLEAAFRKYFHRAEASQEKDSYEILVCHANVIRYFVCRALQFPPEAWLRFVLHHCSITRISIRPSGRVVSFGIGDCGHIPFDQVT